MPVGVAIGHAQFRMRGNVHGSEEWVNILHVRNELGAEPTLDEMAAWAQECQDYMASVAADRHGSWIYTGTDYRSLETANRPTFHDEDNEQGALANKALPTQVALVVTKVCTLAPLKPRLGRNYLNGFTEADLTTNGMLLPARQTEELGKYADFLDAIRNHATFPGVPVVLGWNNLGNPVSQEITSVRVGDRFDTMRSRAYSQPETYAEQNLT